MPVINNMNIRNLLKKMIEDYGYITNPDHITGFLDCYNILNKDTVYHFVVYCDNGKAIQVHIAYNNGKTEDVILEDLL